MLWTSVFEINLYDSQELPLICSQSVFRVILKYGRTFNHGGFDKDVLADVEPTSKLIWHRFHTYPYTFASYEIGYMLVSKYFLMFNLNRASEDYV